MLYEVITNGCHHGHGNLDDPFGKKEHKERNHDAVNDTRQRGMRTGLDVGHGTCDGSCCRDAAKEDGTNVGGPLSDEFRVRFVLV